MMDVLLGAVDPLVIALIVLGGLFSERYLNRWKIPVVFKTLFTGTAFVIIYVICLFIAGDFSNKLVPRFFLSYTVATSLYELLFKFIIDGFQTWKERVRI